MTDLVPRRLRTPAAAVYLGYAESTLEKKRLTGDGPPFIRLGRTIVYDTIRSRRVARSSARYQHQRPHKARAERCTMKNGPGAPASASRDGSWRLSGSAERWGPHEHPQLRPYQRSGL